MKKKFVLTLALVLMVAVTLSAATPIELSGEFGASRTFKFDPNSVGAATKFKPAKLSISNDFWKISVDAGVVDFGNDTMNATAAIYLDKALAEQGIDMGDVTLTLGVGNKGDSGLMHVYYDGDELTKEVAMVGATPRTTDLTIGYTDMVTVKAALNFDLTNKPIAVSAKFAPVDGVKVAAGFTNYAGAGETKGALSASVAVDVAALAGIEDFALSAYVYEGFYLESKDNHIDAAVKASYSDIGLTLALYNKIAATNQTGMSVEASYSGIENVGMSAKLAIADFSNAKAVVSGDVSYTMGLSLIHI